AGAARDDGNLARRRRARRGAGGLAGGGLPARRDERGDGRVFAEARRADAAGYGQAGQDHSPGLRRGRRHSPPGHLRPRPTPPGMARTRQDEHRRPRVRRGTCPRLHPPVARLLRPLRTRRRGEPPPHIPPRPRPVLRGLHRRVPDARLRPQGEHKGPPPGPVGRRRPRQHLRGRGPLRRGRPPHPQGGHPHPRGDAKGPRRHPRHPPPRDRSPWHHLRLLPRRLRRDRPVPARTPGLHPGRRTVPSLRDPHRQEPRRGSRNLHVPDLPAGV
ncbi:MAG: Formamidopyrimidine-DNA glycosylase, partial [uncultured Rubrobacteraceae bacterium]